MSYKYFGRLAGKTYAKDALVLTADANTTTPFNAQAPATKFLAYGENATSLAFNRALGALSANIDCLAGVLDSPALRDEVLNPPYTLAAGATGGYSALKDIAAGTTALDLGAASQPATWLYVGQHASTLADYVRLRSCRRDVAPLSRHVGETAGGYVIAPTGVLPKTGQPNIYGALTQVHDGSGYFGISHENGLANNVPPIQPVITALAPYGGSQQSVAIQDWDADGPRLDPADLKSWADLHVRPGCFVLIQSAVADNNGLFRVAAVQRAKAVSGDKAVLTRGGLHKVTVTDHTKFSAGCLVAWDLRPDHAADPAPDRRCYAHVLHIIPSAAGNVGDLYLSSAGGNEDTTGFKSGAVRVGINRFGLVDQESGADQNWSMPLTTTLHNEGGGSPGTHHAVVTAALPAGYPVQFNTTSNVTGSAVPCNPPGFLLNPVLTLAAGFPPGSYFLEARTLTTVKEQLMSQGSSAHANGFESASANHSFTRSDARDLEWLQKHLAHGLTPHADADGLNQGRVGLASILGPNLWELEFTENNNLLGEFAARFSAGDTVSFSLTSVPTADYVAGTVVAAVGSRAVIAGIRPSANWSTSLPYVRASQLIVEGDTHVSKTVGGNTTLYAVAAGGIIAAPYLNRGGSAARVPGLGLDGAYHADYASDPSVRESTAHGRYVWAHAGWSPISVVLPDGADADLGAGYEVTTDAAGAASSFVTLLAARHKSGTNGGAVRAHIGLRKRTKVVVGGVDKGVLVLKDENSAEVPLASTFDVDLGSHVNAADHRRLPLEMQADTLLGAIESLVLGNRSAAYTAPDHHSEAFGTWSTSLLHGAGIAVNAAAHSVAIDKGFFVRGGVKVYAPEKTIAYPNGAAAAGSYAVVYHSILGDYAITAASPAYDPADEYVPLYRITFVGGVITDLADIRKTLFREDTRNHVYVGNPNSQIADVSRTAHFKCLSDAFSAIEYWTAGGAGLEQRFTIELVGPVKEQHYDAALQLGSTLPMKVPCNGVTVIGHGADTLITWEYKSTLSAVATALIDMNNKSDLRFEDLEVLWTNAGAGGWGPQDAHLPGQKNHAIPETHIGIPWVAAFTSGPRATSGRLIDAYGDATENAAAVGNWLFERVVVKEAGAFLVHGFGLVAESAWTWDNANFAANLDNVTIRNCSGVLTQAGVAITAPTKFKVDSLRGYHTNIRVEGCAFFRTGAHDGDFDAVGTNTGVTDLKAGIILTGCYESVVEGNSVQNFWTGIEVGRLGRTTYPYDPAHQPPIIRSALFGAASSVEVIGNTVHRSGEHGIVVSNGLLWVGPGAGDTQAPPEHLRMVVRDNEVTAFGGLVKVGAASPRAAGIRTEGTGILVGANSVRTMWSDTKSRAAISVESPDGITPVWGNIVTQNRIWLDNVTTPTVEFGVHASFSYESLITDNIVYVAGAAPPASPVSPHAVYMDTCHESVLSRNRLEGSVSLQACPGTSVHENRIVRGAGYSRCRLTIVTGSRHSVVGNEFEDTDVHVGAQLVTGGGQNDWAVTSSEFIANRLLGAGEAADAHPIIYLFANCDGNLFAYNMGGDASFQTSGAPAPQGGDQWTEGQVHAHRTTLIGNDLYRILIVDGEDVRVIDNRVEDVVTEPLVVVDCPRVRIQGNKSLGVAVFGSTDAVVDSNTLHDAEPSWFYSQPYRRAYIDVGYGVNNYSASSDCPRAIIRSNRLLGFGDILVDGAAMGVIQDNHFSIEDSAIISDLPSDNWDWWTFLLVQEPSSDHLSSSEIFVTESDGIHIERNQMSSPIWTSLSAPVGGVTRHFHASGKVRVSSCMGARIANNNLFYTNHDTQSGPYDETLTAAHNPPGVYGPPAWGAGSHSTYTDVGRILVLTSPAAEVIGNTVGSAQASGSPRTRFIANSLLKRGWFDAGNSNYSSGATLMVDNNADSCTVSDNLLRGSMYLGTSISNVLGGHTVVGNKFLYRSPTYGVAQGAPDEALTGPNMYVWAGGCTVAGNHLVEGEGHQSHDTTQVMDPIWKKRGKIILPPSGESVAASHHHVFTGNAAHTIENAVLGRYVGTSPGAARYGDTANGNRFYASVLPAGISTTLNTTEVDQ